MSEFDARQLINLARQTTEQKEVTLPDGTKTMLLLSHQDMRTHELEQYQEKPNQINVSRGFNSSRSYCDYLKKWKNEATTVNIFNFELSEAIRSNSAHRFMISRAIVDDHDLDSPSWRNHKVSLEMSLSSDFLRWCEKDGVRMSQLHFSRWLTDNASTIHAPDLADLIKSVKSYRVTESGSAVSKVDNHSVAASEDYAMKGDELPEFLELAMPVLTFGSPYNIKARIIVEINENKRPSFSYHLINIDKIADHIIKDLMLFIKTETEITPYV